MLNRIWFRYKTDKQNEMRTANKTLLAEICDSSELSLEQIERLRGKILKPSNQLKILSFFSSLFSGLIDGINPYIGALALGLLSNFDSKKVPTNCNSTYWKKIHIYFFPYHKKIEILILISLILHSLRLGQEEIAG